VASIVQETGKVPGSLWAGAENHAPTGIRSPDQQARKELLYQQSYRGPSIILKAGSFCMPISYEEQIPVAGRPKEWVCGLSVDGIVGSIPTGGME
jgi:hypothetical protein